MEHFLLELRGKDKNGGNVNGELVLESKVWCLVSHDDESEGR